MQAHPIPTSLRIHAPAEMRQRVRILVIFAGFSVFEPLAHQIGIETAVKIDNVTVANLEPDRIGDIAAIGENDHIPR